MLVNIKTTKGSKRLNTTADKEQQAEAKKLA
jgi:hypothetical protein